MMRILAGLSLLILVVVFIASYLNMIFSKPHNDE